MVRWGWGWGCAIPVDAALLLAVVSFSLLRGRIWLGFHDSQRQLLRLEFPSPWSKRAHGQVYEGGGEERRARACDKERERADSARWRGEGRIGGIGWIARTLSPGEHGCRAPKRCEGWIEVDRRRHLRPGDRALWSCRLAGGIGLRATRAEWALSREKEYWLPGDIWGLISGTASDQGATVARTRAKRRGHRRCCIAIPWVLCPGVQVSQLVGNTATAGVAQKEFREAAAMQQLAAVSSEREGAWKCVQINPGGTPGVEAATHCPAPKPPQEKADRA